MAGAIAQLWPTVRIDLRASLERRSSPARGLARGSTPATPTSSFRPPGSGRISEAREFAPHFLNNDASAIVRAKYEAQTTESRSVPESVIREGPEDRDYNRRSIRIPRT